MMHHEDIGANAAHQYLIRGPNGVRFLRAPCKARSVKVEPGQSPHDARHAYIDIPLYASHGTILQCSHPVCSGSGRRFQWCAVCEMAVAKRNFNQRHAHGQFEQPSSRRFRPRQGMVTYKDDASSVSSTSVGEKVKTQPAVAVSLYDADTSTVQFDNDDQKWMSLTPDEVDLINHVRSRPEDDRNGRLRLWRDTLDEILETKFTPSPVKRTEDSHNDTNNESSVATSARHFYQMSVSSFPCDESDEDCNVDEV